MNINIIINEIKKRSVWQIIGIYLVAGWGAFEAITSLTKTAGLPEWFPAGSLAILILFLPIVIAVSLIKDSDENQSLNAKATINAEKKDANQINIDINKTINWKPAFISGAAIMIMLSIVSIIFFTDDQDTITKDGPDVLNDKRTINEITEYSSINFYLTPNDSEITYSLLSDKLETTETITTNQKALKLIPGNYKFIISNKSYNTLIFIKLLEKNKIQDINLVLIKNSRPNFNMVHVEEGFLASDPSGSMIEEFKIDKNEVSNNNYLNFVSSGGYKNQSLWKSDSLNMANEFTDNTNLPGPRNWSGSLYPEGTGNQPVSTISWYEADAYCQWQGKKLPSFAQWWRAAIGNEEYTFPWGNTDLNMAKRANYDSQTAWEITDNFYGSSKYGIYDMAGNVAEWSDKEAISSSAAAILGGSWQDSSYIFDINIKENLPLNFNSNNIGFRCVM